MIQIVKRPGNLQETPPVFIADGMIDESRQKSHDNVTSPDPRSVLGAPLILANKDLQGGHLVILIVKRSCGVNC